MKLFYEQINDDDDDEYGKTIMACYAYAWQPYLH